MISDETNNGAAHGAGEQELAAVGELESCKKEQHELQSKLTQLRADMDNFQRRIIRERGQWFEQAQMDVLGKLLDIVDNFDRAIEQYENSDDQQLKQTCSQWFDGFVMIRSSLHKYLEQCNVKRMDNYTEFNPQYHEALMQTASDSHASGAIVQVLQHGYLYRDQVLRVAKVAVAS